MKKLLVLISCLLMIGIIIGTIYIRDYNDKYYAAGLAESISIQDHLLYTTGLEQDAEEDSTPKEKQKPSVTDKEKPGKVEDSTLLELDIPRRIQETDYYCVPACIQMAFSYFNIPIEQRELADAMHTSSVTGTEYVDMAATLNQYIFSTDSTRKGAYQVQTLTIHDTNPQHKAVFEQRVKQDLEDGYPPFAAVNLHILYPNLPVANHMIIIKGMKLSSQGEPISYIILDPYHKVQDPVYGGLKEFSVDTLWQAIITNEEPAYLW